MSALIYPKQIVEIREKFAKSCEYLISHVNNLVGYTLLDNSVKDELVEAMHKKVLDLYQYVYQTPHNKLTDEKAKEIVDAILNFVWMRYVVPTNGEIGWNQWADDPLGLLVRGAIARYKLNKGLPVNGFELAILSGTSVGNISNMVRRGKIKAEKVETDKNREWQIPAEEALAYLEGRE